jgi:glycine/serine hydroxymethyltransferase
MGTDEMRLIGGLIVDALEGRDDAAEQRRVADRVAELSASFPVPGLDRATSRTAPPA